jgi:hypothetical protein
MQGLVDQQGLLSSKVWTKEEMIQFFLTLQKDWVPKNLKWCHQCGKFKPRDTKYWNDVAEKQMTKSNRAVGMAKWDLSAAIEHGWFGRMVSIWRGQTARRVNSKVKNRPTCQIFLDARMR